jgi:hypothetical protein
MRRRHVALSSAGLAALLSATLAAAYAYGKLGKGTANTELGHGNHQG